jgi:hypothetical protein
MSDKIDFKLKNITTNKGICLVVKEWTHQENKTIMNTYAPNIRAHKYIKQTILSVMDRTSNRRAI